MSYPLPSPVRPFITRRYLLLRAGPFTAYEALLAMPSDNLALLERKFLYLPRVEARRDDLSG